MDRDHFLPSPLPQLAGKSGAGSDRAVRRTDGPTCERGFHFGVKPQAIIATVLHVPQKVGRGVQGVAAEKDLGHW